MKKYLFLIVMGTLITFTACKKENMIIGEWEVVSTECDENSAYWYLEFPTVYVFKEDYYLIKHNFMWIEIIEVECGSYFIKNNKITFGTTGGGQFGMNRVTHSMKISFSGAKKMTLKDKNIKLKFKKIS